MRDDLVNLYKKCFDDSEQYIEYFFNNKYRRNNTIIAKDSNKIIATLFLIPKKIRLRGVELSFPYIVGACTDPMYRGQGIMNNLIYDAIIKLHNRGNAIVGLYPFRHSFYAKQGFVTINRMCKNKVNYINANLSYSVATINDTKELSAFYRLATANYDSKLLRNKRDFASKIEEVMSAPGKTVIIRDKDNIIGYCMYDSSEIIEYLGQGIEGIRELDSREYYVDSEQGEEYAMMRIVNPCKLLGRLKYPSNLTTKIRIKVEDTFVPLNTSIMLLDISESKCIITDSATYDYVVTIEELTLLITGSYLREGYRPPDILCDLFPPARNLILDKY